MTRDKSDRRTAPADGDSHSRLPPSEESVSSAETEDSSSSREVDDSASSISSVVSHSDFAYPPQGGKPVVLEEDKETPDSHVPRDPRLIRLTGVHPFNVEAPLTDLFNEGFLTSPDLFYVRNHGAVPEVRDDQILDWEFSVEGLVQHPFKMTVRDLMQEFENVTYPITLVCAGNRRKEQNMVKKSKGFNWGAAGLSTALFTGVTLPTILQKAKPKRGGKYLYMEGADELPNGRYATTVKLNWAIDPNKGMMLAHAMNGEPLRPDHGKPLRVVIPGQIGGRSVKWLTKLEVVDKPSDNFYHIYDNRVLPTSISPEQSAQEEHKATWMDERYAIYDLNPNSAIVYPEHDEKLTMTAAPEKYRLKGYAYAGGGRRVGRVEISIDKGKTWRLTNVDYPEDAYREADEDTQLFGGRLDMWWRESCFCWCFWNLDVDVEELSEAKDIFVRCMDDGMAVQPRDMYWSVMGMMNNPWFRVTITKDGDDLHFEHPTQPALKPGGWMERVNKEGGNLSNGFWGEKIGEEDERTAPKEPPQEVKMTKDDIDKEITLDELRKHKNKEEPWFVLNGEVYDGTSYLKEHPGGAQSIFSAAGKNVTDEFMAIHSETAKKMMVDFHIGTLDEEGKETLGEDDVGEDEEDDGSIFLRPKRWVKGVLDSKISVSWDTRVFTFKMEHEDQSLGLPTGQHLMMRLRDPVTREAIIRSYTPISHESRKGYIDVLIKVYFDTKEREGGKMSQALDGIPVGHFVEFKGPIGKFEYLGKGLCTISGEERKVGTFVMVCGGSGVTPIYQVLRACMEDEEDETKCIVLDGNRLEEDILCREDLDRFAASNVERCKLLHTLTKATDTWEGLRGRIAPPLLQEHAPVVENGLALICGPKAMEEAVHKALLEQGWKEEDLLFF